MALPQEPIALARQQIYSFFRSEAHFPARFPELAELEIRQLELPGWDQAPQAGEAAAKGRAGEPSSRKQKSQQQTRGTAADEVVRVLEITEVQDAFVKRVVLLSDVRSVFLPYDADPKKLSLDEGEWLVGPQIQNYDQAIRNLGHVRSIVSENNPLGLGIAFVAESARVLNIVSIAASAGESGFIHDRLTLGKREPCC